MKKKVWIPLLIVGILLLLIAALALAAPHLVFKFIFSQPERSTEVPDYYIGTPHYIVSQAGLKAMKEMPSEDAWLTSRDGLKLHAYLFPAEEHPKKFVIGVHGYRSYSRPEYAPYIEFYQSLGYSMLLPDDRAHLPSEGDYIGFGVLDRLDCVDWAKYLVQTYGEDIEILLHGVSMGGATVCAASGEADLPGQVRGIVCDCGFTCAWDALSSQLKAMGGIDQSRTTLPRIEKICRRRAGFDFHRYSAVEQVKQAKVPILFVQGARDAMVPAHMAQELYDACASRKELMIVEEAGHAESIAFEPERYHRTIREFFGI